MSAIPTSPRQHFARAAFFLFAASTCALVSAQQGFIRNVSGIYANSGSVLNTDGTIGFAGNIYGGNTFFATLDATGAPLVASAVNVPGYDITRRGYLQDAAGRTVMAVEAQPPGSANSHAVLSAWDAAHNLLWANSYMLPGYHAAGCYTGAIGWTMPQGYVVQTSYYDTTGVLDEVQGFLHLDGAGNVIWAKSCSDNVYVIQLVPADDGGYYALIAGGVDTLLVMKTDSQFGASWCRWYTAPEEVATGNLVLGTGGDLHLLCAYGDTTWVHNGGGYEWPTRHAWLTLDPANGDLLATRELENPWLTRIGVRPLSDGNYLLAGGHATMLYYTTFNLHTDGLIQKITPDGSLLWADSLHFNTSSSARVLGVTESDGKFLLSIEYHDGLNPFRKIMLLDTSGVSSCNLFPYAPPSLGPLPFTSGVHALVPFSTEVPVVTAFTPTTTPYNLNTSVYCSDVITGSAEHEDTPLHVWPVPADDHVMIAGDALAPSGTIVEVMDMTGAVHHLSSRRNGEGLELDIHDLGAGIYVARVRGPGGLARLRFVKQ
ncbi:MAG: T9SS type A sorting domain-containing protein [Flavobacteriales bacterium]